MRDHFFSTQSFRLKLIVVTGEFVASPRLLYSLSGAHSSYLCGFEIRYLYVMCSITTHIVHTHNGFIRFRLLLLKDFLRFMFCKGLRLESLLPERPHICEMNRNQEEPCPACLRVVVAGW